MLPAPERALDVCPILGAGSPAFRHTLVCCAVKYAFEACRIRQPFTACPPSFLFSFWNPSPGPLSPMAFDQDLDVSRPPYDHPPADNGRAAAAHGVSDNRTCYVASTVAPISGADGCMSQVLRCGRYERERESPFPSSFFVPPQCDSSYGAPGLFITARPWGRARLYHPRPRLGRGLFIAAYSQAHPSIHPNVLCVYKRLMDRG